MLESTVIQKEETIVVGLGEIQVSRNTFAILSCLGLGSCVAVCAYDPVSKVGGMAHVVLPNSGGKLINASVKYADIAVPFLLKKLIEQGGHKSRLIIKLSGGAQMSLTLGVTNMFNTGEKNRIEIEAALAKEKIFPVAVDIGGNQGRTVRMFLDTGKIMVKNAGGEIWEL